MSNNLKEMPNPNENPNQAAEERKRIAKDHFDRIRTAAVVQSRNSLLIGYHAQILKEQNLWGSLGFANEHECREAAGVSDSGWYSVIRIAEAFKGLPEELFTGMKLSNAVVLCDLSESKRMDRDWVQKASDESLKTFKRLVDEELNGKARSSDTKERVTTLRVSMPVSRQVVIEEKAKELLESHGMEAGDVGKAIEIALVEATGGETYTAVLLRVIERCKRIKETLESGLSADEALAVVVTLNEDMILDVSSVLGTKRDQEEAA